MIGRAGRKDVCPACGSPDVVVGCFPLECLSCGWHHLNRYPCRACGKPSRSAAGCSRGGKSVALYGCAEHPITTAEVGAVMGAVGWLGGARPKEVH